MIRRWVLHLFLLILILFSPRGIMRPLWDVSGPCGAALTIVGVWGLSSRLDRGAAALTKRYIIVYANLPVENPAAPQDPLLLVPKTPSLFSQNPASSPLILLPQGLLGLAWRPCEVVFWLLGDCRHKLMLVLLGPS